MIKKILIYQDVIEKIQKNISRCNEGKLLGWSSDPDTGLITVTEARPIGMPVYWHLKRVGIWGTNLDLCPAFPAPDEIFILTDGRSDIQVYQVLSQGVEPVKDFEVISDDHRLLQHIQRFIIGLPLGLAEVKVRGI